MFYCFSLKYGGGEYRRWMYGGWRIKAIASANPISNQPT
jgi:hypothetical protein